MNTKQVKKVRKLAKKVGMENVTDRKYTEKKKTKFVVDRATGKIENREVVTLVLDPQSPRGFYKRLKASYGIANQKGVDIPPVS